MLRLAAFLTTCLLLLTSSLSLAQQNTDFLNDPDHQFWHDDASLSDLTLVFSQQAWDDLHQSTQNSRIEVSANMSYMHYGTEYILENIGVKLSGNTSFVLPTDNQGRLIQANYTLDFDEFVDDQSLKGISALKLKRFKDDPTFVREPLSNRIMQSFGIFTAHSSNHVKVYVKIGDDTAQYIGIYRLNESVNRHEYIDKRFASDNDSGFLWQGNYKAYGPALFSRITAQWDGVADADNASFEYKGKGSKFEEAKAQLVRIANNLTSLEGEDFKEYAERHINMPLFLKFLAAEAVIGHWDGFWGNANNYMFYIDEQEVIHFIPFDTDNTLGTSAIVRDAGEQSPVQFGVSENTPPLISKILDFDEFLAEFLHNIRALVTEENLMTESESVLYITTIHNLIKNDLTNVTNQNDELADRPASWGNQSTYRLFELSTGKNWYSTRKASVERVLGLPVARVCCDMSVEVGSVVTLSAKDSSAPNGSIVSYEWSNGLSGEEISTTVTAQGATSITLTVTDNFGFSATTNITLTGNSPAPSPQPVPQDDASGGGSFSFFFFTLFVVMTYYRLKFGKAGQHRYD